MKSQTLYQVDAFTTEPYYGNPAGVLLQSQSEAQEMTDETRQKIASEMNLSETAFVVPREAGDAQLFQTSSHFELRWFTPEKEVALCGHATLAAAEALLTGEGNKSESIQFHTRESGELVVRRNGSGSDFQLAMDLPNEDPNPSPPDFAAPESALVKAIVGDLGANVDSVHFAERLTYLMIVLKRGTTQQELESMRPDTRAMLSLASKQDLVLAIVTVQGEGDLDFISRVFCPWAGIDEDPVTGSAHAVMGPFWARTLGKKNLRARQCSKRGGDLGVEVLGDGTTVRVCGNAAIVFKAALRV